MADGIRRPTTPNFLRQCALHFLSVHLFPSTDGTFDNTAAPVRNPFPFLPQAKYARVRPHRHSDRPQLGKCGATLLLPRKSVGRDMGARAVIRRRDRLRRRFRQAGKVRDPRTGQGPKVHVYFLNPPTLSLRRAVDPAPTSQQIGSRTSVPHG